MQHDNATGANQNEQGQASFATGSTTGGGSNFGQGSSHLGGESYRQGDRTNTGSNYNNEEGRIGNSSTGTSNEGASSYNAGAAQSGAAGSQDLSADSARDNGAGNAGGDLRGQQTDSNEIPKEGERRDTSLERDTHLNTDNTTADRRTDSGSWSNSSSETGHEL